MTPALCEFVEDAGVTDTGYSSTGKVHFGETPKVRARLALHARRGRYQEVEGRDFLWGVAELPPFIEDLAHQRARCPLAPQARCPCYKVSLRGVIFCEIRSVHISITNYLDVMSSWCFWSQPTWAELKRRYADRVDFDWKIALMDGAGLPKSRAQEKWYYRRSGLMNRSLFMLRSDSYEPVLPEYLAPNLVAEAARDLGGKDDSVRLALSNSILREGSKAIRDVEVAAEIGARAGGLEKAKLLERAQAPEIEKRIRQSTADWEALKVMQRPTFLIDTEIGDRAIFSGVIRLEPIAATLDSMIDDAVAYAAHAAHFGAPPAQ